MSKVKTLKNPQDFSKKYVLNHFGKSRWESIEKIFGLVLMFPCLKRQSKVENNWESTNNLKLWLLNISRDFLLCKIIASCAVDTEDFQLADSSFEEWKHYYSWISIFNKTN